ncbi:MAG: YqgE/AlgH family protein [Acidimicrobiales bacterium]|nr:YqgE/AlgH family protein [Acidimicrobiales bacterium]
MNRSIRGRLLVATPELRDPNFARSVVLVLEHTEQGALGVVLNHPRLVAGGEAVPRWAERLAYPGRLHRGGPVSDNSIIGLGCGSGQPSEGLSVLQGYLGVVDLHMDPTDVPEIDQVRLFSGYAGWDSGQLEAELAAGGWIVVESCEEDAFTPEPAQLWRDVLGRQQGFLGLLAGYPDDCSLN